MAPKLRALIALQRTQGEFLEFIWYLTTTHNSSSRASNSLLLPDIPATRHTHGTGPKTK